MQLSNQLAHLGVIYCCFLTSLPAHDCLNSKSDSLKLSLNYASVLFWNNFLWPQKQHARLKLLKFWACSQLIMGSHINLLLAGLFGNCDADMHTHTYSTCQWTNNLEKVATQGEKLIGIRGMDVCLHNLRQKSLGLHGLWSWGDFILITIIVLWSWTNFVQKGPWSDPKAASVEEGNSEKEKDRESSRREPRVTSAKSAELQVHTSWQVTPSLLTHL